MDGYCERRPIGILRLSYSTAQVRRQGSSDAEMQTFCVKLVENLLNLEKIGFGERSEPNPIFSKFSRFETNFELTPRPRTVIGSHQSSLELL